MNLEDKNDSRNSEYYQALETYVEQVSRGGCGLLQALPTIVFNNLTEECMSFMGFGSEDYINIDELLVKILNAVQDKLAHALVEYTEQNKEVELYNHELHDYVTFTFTEADKEAIKKFAEEIHGGRPFVDKNLYSNNWEDKLRFNSVLDNIAINFYEDIEYNIYNNVLSFMYDKKLIGVK